MQSSSPTLSFFTPNLKTDPNLKTEQSSFRIKKVDRSNFLITNYPYQPNHKLTQIQLELAQRHKSNINLITQEEEFEEERKIEIKQLLNDSREEKIHDKRFQTTVGQEAIKKYYRHLKIINKVTEQNRIYNVSDSIFTAMHKESNKSKLFPCKVGIVKYKGHENTISLNHMKYGDSYINILKEGVSQTPQFENFYMKDNRITPRMSVNLIKSLSKGARSLILQKNRIGADGIQNISNLLQQRDCKIEVLDIEDNSLTNNIIEQFCRTIHLNKTLQVLNLSKNFISNSACLQIASMLSDNFQLKELYLHWNRISSQGGVYIFQGLRTNQCLKVLDLSCNSLGIGQMSCAPAFSEMVIQNIDLIHVDLSFNQFNYKDTEIIASGLVKNQTIYGFHFAGNKGYVDSKGFLVAVESAEEDESQSQISNRIQGCSYINQNRIRTTRDKILKDCCWICEGWNQQTLQWKIGESGDFDQDPIFIHLNYNDFLPLYLGKPENGLKTLRMLPPGRLIYFFTTGEDQCIAKDQKIMNHHTRIIKDVFIIDQFEQVELNQLNYAEIKVQKQVIDKFYEPTIQVIPRTKDLIYIPPKIKKYKKKWTFPISLFKDWRKDDDELLQKCFDVDWNGSRISRIIKNSDDAENTKQFIWSIYRYLKDLYKQYSSLSPVGDIWAIQSNSFLQLIQNLKLVENPSNSNKNIDDQDQLQRQSKATIKQQDLDLKFIGTISGTEKGNPRKPERGLIRFQFIELWVRVAEEKYLKTGAVNTIFDAMKCLWEDHLKSESVLFTTQSWRDERYWNENCDYCYKNYKLIMEHIYSKYSNKKVKPGQKNFMSLQELIDLTIKAGLNQIENFGSNVPFLSFNRAMMTQIDELKQDRIFQMNFVEFLEAFARIADEANLPPYKGAIDVINIFRIISQSDQEWTYFKVKDLPLHFKLESLILHCLDNVADLSFKLNYPKPVTSFFTPVPDSDDG